MSLKGTHSKNGESMPLVLMRRLLLGAKRGAKKNVKKIGLLTAPIIILAIPFITYKLASGFIWTLLSVVGSVWLSFGLVIYIQPYYFLTESQKKSLRKYSSEGALWFTKHGTDPYDCWREYLKERFANPRIVELCGMASEEVPQRMAKKAFTDGFLSEKAEANLKILIQESEFMQHGVSCRKCSGVAYPQPGISKKYVCDCGNMFFGPKHPF